MHCIALRYATLPHSDNAPIVNYNYNYNYAVMSRLVSARSLALLPIVRRCAAARISTNTSNIAITRTLGRSFTNSSVAKAEVRSFIHPFLKPFYREKRLIIYI